MSANENNSVDAINDLPVQQDSESTENETTETPEQRSSGDPALELVGLQHRLVRKKSNDSFRVTVDDLVITRGSFVALLGESGCGKTTLLTILGLLRKPSNNADLKTFAIHVPENGKLQRYDLKELYRQNQQNKIEGLRRRHIGFALQSGELLPALTVRENISLPLRLNGDTDNNRVDELLKTFNLEHRAHSMSDTLSGGEYQRVALARAIVHRPALIFVDEPTANLNAELAKTALLQLRQLQLHETTSSSIVMITHDRDLAFMFADVIIELDSYKFKDENGIERPAGKVIKTSSNTPTIDNTYTTV